MSKYELVVIVDASLGQAQKDGINKQIVEAINKLEGKVINSNVWLEKQRFTFPMKKVWDGTYIIFNVELKTGTIADLRSAFRLNESILRFLLIKVNSTKAVAAKV